MNTKSIGDISVQEVILAFLKKDCSVSVPIGDNQKYDIIVDNNVGLQRIQCKTGKLKSGVITANVGRVHIGKSKKSEKFLYTKTEIDCIAIYCPDTDKCYLLTADDMNVSTEWPATIQLRVEELTSRISKTPMKLAVKYEI